MEKFAILARVESKPGKETEVLEFLKSALSLAQAEDGTMKWYALQIGPTTFGIFDTFETEEARKAHLDGQIENFLASFARTMADMSEVDLETHKKSCINLLLEKNKNLSDENRELWRHIDDEDFEFDAGECFDIDIALNYWVPVGCIRPHVRMRITQHKKPPSAILICPIRRPRRRGKDCAAHQSRHDRVLQPLYRSTLAIAGQAGRPPARATGRSRRKACSPGLHPVG